MVIASIRPSTVDGIKQLAKKIRRERNITHTEALDDAARQAGYENFMHAKRQLSARQASGAAPTVFPVYLSVHWRASRHSEDVPDIDSPLAGREILCIELTRPLSEVVAKNRVDRARGLRGFRMEYEDHLEHQTDVVGRDEARKALLAAARSLRFMEATGLQPVSLQKHRNMMRELDRLPGRDHVSQWFDPSTDSCILLDEPYARAIGGKADERQRWLEANNWVEAAPAWGGIYYPGETVPLLVSQDVALLQRTAVALSEQEPLTDTTQWPHETGLNGDDFVSPRRLADQKMRRPRPRASWRDHKGARPYGGAPGVRSSWRPAKPMPIEMHKQLGSLMQRLSMGFSSRVRQKLEVARFSLEDWAINEHRHEHSDVVYDLYTGGPNLPVFDTDADRLAALKDAHAIVEKGYDDCKPRRELLAALDAGIAEVASKV